MKLLLRILNIVYLAICAVACITIFTSPILSFSGTSSISKDSIVLLVKDAIKDEGSGDELTEEEIRNCLDFGEGKDKLDLKLDLSIPTSLVFDNKNVDNTKKIIDEHIDPLVVDIIDKLEPSINNLAEKIVTKKAKGPLKDAINDQILLHSASFDTSKLEEMNLGDEFLEEFIGDVFDIIVDGGTVDILTDLIGEKIDIVCSTLKENNVEGFESYDSSLIDDMSEEVKNGIVDALKNAGFCDDEGNIIPIEEYICNLLPDDEEEENSRSIKFNLTPEQEEKKKEAHDKLVKKITNLLKDPINKLDLPQKVADYGQYGKYVIYALLAPWLIFAIITFVKTLLRKRIGTRPWIVFSFASTSLILGVGLTFFGNFIFSKISGMIPASNEILKDILGTMAISVKTGLFVASIMYLIMIPLSIVYVIFRAKYKKQLKAKAQNS